MKKETLQTIIKASISIILMVLILIKVGPENSISGLSNVNLFIIIPIILMPFVHLIGALKWQIVVKLVEQNITLKEAFISFIGGMALGFLTPAKIGELGRIVFLKSNRKKALIGLALYDKGVDLLIALTFAVLGIFYFLNMYAGLLWIICLVIGYALLAFPKSTLIMRFLSIKKLKKFKQTELIKQAINEFSQKSIIQVFLLRFIVSILDMTQFYFLILAFQDASFNDVMIGYPFILLTNILPITIGGIGIREGAAVLLMQNFNVVEYVALNASFFLFILNTLLPSILGALYFYRINLNVSTLRRYVSDLRKTKTQI